MIQIDSYIKLALSFFELSLSIRDVEYITVEGEDTKTLVEERTIQAAVDPSRSREMERIFSGSISDGDVGVYTTEILYIDDVHDSTDSSGQRLQSFLTYQGHMYRVSNHSDWVPQAGMNVYLCKRYFAQDIESLNFEEIGEG